MSFRCPNAWRRCVDTLGSIVVGKQTPLKLALACLLARGHLLIEDIPGVGKSTLAQALAATLGLQYARVQFTSDLLPADVLGVSIFDPATHAFRFHSGPIFHSIVLADEINRAPPKTQSALLEAMEERQVSIDGKTRPLPEPFFVIATQNPAEQIGAYPLPESQLDRFLMTIELGYPEPAAERELLLSGDRRARIAELAPCADAATLLAWQREAAAVHVAPALLDYVQALLAASRGVGGRAAASRRRASRPVAARGPAAGRGQPRLGAPGRPADGAAGGRAGRVSRGRRPSPRRQRARRRAAGAGAAARGAAALTPAIGDARDARAAHSSRSTQAADLTPHRRAGIRGARGAAALWRLAPATATRGPAPPPHLHPADPARLRGDRDAGDHAADRR